MNFFNREIQESLRIFSQFHTATEHDQFLRQLKKERALRLRIRELVKYRRNGLTRQDECTEYERARYFRDKRKVAKQERMRRKSVSHLFRIEFVYCWLLVGVEWYFLRKNRFGKKKYIIYYFSGINSEGGKKIHNWHPRFGFVMDRVSELEEIFQICLNCWNKFRSRFFTRIIKINQHKN